MKFEEVELIFTVEKTDARLKWCEHAFPLRTTDFNHIQREGIFDKAAAGIVPYVEHPLIFVGAIETRAVEGRPKRVAAWWDIIEWA